MSHNHVAPSFRRTARAALFFGPAVILGEMTFGNPEFPLTIWYFEKIPAWQWSLPVHLAGFLWLTACNRLFINRSVLVPVFLAALFFLVGEALNWYVFDFFAYVGDLPWQKALSFWVVFAMYIGLCTAAVLILRTPANENP